MKSSSYLVFLRFSFYALLSSIMLSCGFTKMPDRMNDMLKEMQNMKKDTHQMNQKMDKLDQMQEMNTKMSSMNEQMKVMSQMAKTMLGMDDKMKELVRQIELMVEMKGTMEKMMAVMNGMSGKMDGMATGMSNLETMMKAMNSTMQTMVSLMGELKTMSQKMDNMDKGMTTLVTHMTSMKEAMDKMIGLMGELENMSKMMAKMTTKMDGVSDNMLLLKTAMDSMKTDLGDMLKAMLTMQASMGKLDDMTNIMKIMAAKMDKMDKMDEMAELMKAMRTDMKDLPVMRESLGLMLNLMQELKGFAYDLREGVAHSARQSALQAMNKSPALQSKIAAASAYFSSFTFQLWKGEGPDTPAVRLRMYNSAMEEFFKDVQEFYKPRLVEEKPEPDDTLKNSEANKTNNLYALGASVHRLSPLQEEQFLLMKEKKVEFQKVSFLDLLQTGLKKIQEELDRKSKTSEQEKYIQEIAKFNQIAFNVLEFRYNFLLLFGLKLATNIEDKMNKDTVLSKLTFGLSNKLSMLFSNLQISEERLRVTAQSRYVVKVFCEALKMRNFFLRVPKVNQLKDLSLSHIPIFDTSLTAYLAGVKIPGSDISDKESIATLMQELSVPFKTADPNKQFGFCAF